MDFTRMPNHVSKNFSFFVSLHVSCVIVAFPFLFIDRIVGTKPLFFQNILVFYLFRIPLTVPYFRVHISIAFDLLTISHYNDRCSYVLVPPIQITDIADCTLQRCHIVCISIFCTFRGLCTFFRTPFGCEWRWAVDVRLCNLSKSLLQSQARSTNKLALLNLLNLFDTEKKNRGRQSIWDWNVKSI